MLKYFNLETKRYDLSDIFVCQEEKERKQTKMDRDRERENH